MSVTVKSLQELRAPIGAEIRKMADRVNAEGRDFTAEERATWDKANADFNRLSGQIEVARRAEEVDASLAERRERPPGAEDRIGGDPLAGADKPMSPKKRARVMDEARALALQGWVRRQAGRPLTAEHKRACKLVGLSPSQRDLPISLPTRPMTEQRTTNGGLSALPANGSSGGDIVPQGFVYQLETALKMYGGARAVADVIRTAAGNALPWPSANDTANSGTLLSENTQVSEVEPTFGVTTFNAYKFTSGIVFVPIELMEDNAFDLATWIASALGERLGRGQATYFTTGTGTSQPQGIITGATAGVTTASSTAIAPDEIIDLIHKVDPAYRTDPSMRLMMHDLILAVVRKLKDGQGRYLFEEGNNGAPDRIKGVQIAINQSMASTVATGNKTMLAGPMNKFKIRDVNQVRFRRLDERYADFDQVAFVAFLRSDSKVLDAGTHPLQLMTQL